jgi:hypothetical protein
MFEVQKASVNKLRLTSWNTLHTLVVTFEMHFREKSGFNLSIPFILFRVLTIFLSNVNKMPG